MINDYRLFSPIILRYGSKTGGQNSGKQNAPMLQQLLTTTTIAPATITTLPRTPTTVAATPTIATPLATVATAQPAGQLPEVH